jgi:hypothetical protein
MKTAPYVGEGRKKQQYFFISLTAMRGTWEDEFSMVGFLGKDLDPIGEVCIRCLFLGISTYNYPTAGEMVLVKKVVSDTDEKSLITLQEAQKLVLSRYLLLKHNRIRLKPLGGAIQMESLTVKGFLPNEIAHMVGTYKVLNLNGRGQLAISKFTIGNDYKSYFYTDAFRPNLNSQVCLMEVSNIVRDRLCITTHPDTGAGLIACVMLNIPMSGDKIIEGAFCSIGNAKSTYPVANQIVLLKTNDPSDFMTTIDNPDKTLPKMGDKALLEAYEKLKKISRRSL